MPLTLENVWYFKFPFRSRCAHVLLERKAKLINRFLCKKKKKIVEFPVWVYQLEIFGKSSIVDVWQSFELCLNMLKYAWMFLNLPEWLLLYFPIVITWLFERVVTNFNFYTWTISYSLRYYKAVLLKRQNLILTIVAESIWFVFCFRLNVFTRFQVTLFNYLGTKLISKIVIIPPRSLKLSQKVQNCGANVKKKFHVVLAF